MKRHPVHDQSLKISNVSSSSQNKIIIGVSKSCNSNCVYQYNHKDHQKAQYNSIMRMITKQKQKNMLLKKVVLESLSKIIQDITKSLKQAKQQITHKLERHFQLIPSQNADQQLLNTHIKDFSRQVFDDITCQDMYSIYKKFQTKDQSLKSQNDKNLNKLINFYNKINLQIQSNVLLILAKSIQNEKVHNMKRINQQRNSSLNSSNQSNNKSEYSNVNSGNILSPSLLKSVKTSQKSFIDNLNSSQQSTVLNISKVSQDISPQQHRKMQIQSDFIPINNYLKNDRFIQQTIKNERAITMPQNFKTCKILTQQQRQFIRQNPYQDYNEHMFKKNTFQRVHFDSQNILKNTEIKSNLSSTSAVTSQLNMYFSQVNSFANDDYLNDLNQSRIQPALDQQQQQQQQIKLAPYQKVFSNQFIKRPTQIQNSTQISKPIQMSRPMQTNKRLQINRTIQLNKRAQINRPIQTNKRVQINRTIQTNKRAQTNNQIQLNRGLQTRRLKTLQQQYQQDLARALQQSRSFNQSYSSTNSTRSESNSANIKSQQMKISQIHNSIDTLLETKQKFNITVKVVSIFDVFVMKNNNMTTSHNRKPFYKMKLFVADNTGCSVIFTDYDAKIIPNLVVHFKSCFLITYGSENNYQIRTNSKIFTILNNKQVIVNFNKKLSSINNIKLVSSNRNQTRWNYPISSYYIKIYDAIAYFNKQQIQQSLLGKEIMVFVIKKLTPSKFIVGDYSGRVILNVDKKHNKSSVDEGDTLRIQRGIVRKSEQMLNKINFQLFTHHQRCFVCNIKLHKIIFHKDHIPL